MSRWLQVAAASARVEAATLRRSPTLLVFVLLQAVMFLVLVSLFGLTGSRAPTALVQLDRGPYAAHLVYALEHAHRSFDLRPMSASAAHESLRRGRIVAIVTIPAHFSATVAAGGTVALPVDVDNVDVDLTDDIQRAVPSAIAQFGRNLHLPQIRVAAHETDLVDHETGYVPYLVVSALALDGFLLATFLGALAVAREWETSTVKLWRLAPTSPTALLTGKLAVAAATSLIALLLTALVVVAGYGVKPSHPLTAVGGLALCVAISAAFGGWLGTVVKRTMAIVPLVFGLALPLYLDGGTLEPERFDGNTIWAIAHVTPVYYAVGILEHAFHRLRVTPEPVWLNALILVAFAVAAAAAARRRIRRAMLR